ncbi:Adenine DNA glycosylase [Colletotrichum tanaceti]|uniref:Adenine DNA glycosylase n=1 Tax=Colletotrichum tanaceti TaxID=1306861 RepID=A0A4V6DHJ8_9PEZI|nr:Adenine DNA glycosylase [Colletotrichum tanaceti]TKW56826.1 Adenine DNA glycosylase [Colletotrichum tanaceti]
MIERRSVRRQSSLAAAKRILAQADDEPDDDELVRVISKRRKVAAKPREEDAFEADFAPRAGDDDGDNDDEDEVNETKQEKEEEHEEIEGIVETLEPQPKRRKVEKTRKADTAKLHARLFGPSTQATTKKTTTTCSAEACSPRSRTHAVTYHRPLLLDGQPGRRGRDALLAWFDAVSTTRGMPWRKPWIDPQEPRNDDNDDNDLRAALERRAYEVWISEIMLQQTRVAVVIDYWNRWMARWPTIQDLAAAPPEDVVSAWRGLGYYSRATRIHEAAKLVVGDPGWDGLMPADTAELEAKVPGVGRYTAGAISAIVFGRPAPMVDGNVLRVLSRQLGVFGNAKSDKTVIDLLWAAADALVQAVAKDGRDDDNDDGVDDDEEKKVPPTSDRPGRWGQALMELGSTVCTPKPNCGECPVTSTCRAYAEGLLLAAAKPRKGEAAVVVEDIEDLCSICEPFEEDEAAASGGDSDTDAPKTARGAKKGGTKSRPVAKQATLSAFFSPKTTQEVEPSAPKQPAVNAKTLEVVANHAKRFPLKVVKKAVRSEEALVCAVRRRRDGRFLVHRRPDKGLLAGLWELPSHTLPAGTTTTTKKRASTASSRRRDAQGYVAGLLDGNGEKKPVVRHVGDLGSVPWLFSHLKLTMHVHLFEVEGDEDLGSSHARHRWATAEEVDEESMGTGMRKCWALVRERMEE